MSRRIQVAGALAVFALALVGRTALAQGPTLEPTATPIVGGAPGSLGAAPGSLDSNLGVMPGVGSQDYAPDPTVLGGRPGASVPRVPTTISTPGGPGQAPMAGGAVTLPAPLQVQPPPVYGTLDFPTLAEEPPAAGGLTLDQAIERLVRENLQLRGQFLELPQAQADILTASLRANPILYADAQLVPYGSYSIQRPGGPVQYDINISHPFDINGKRQARMAVAGRAKQVLEAQYQDAVRLQIGNLYTSFANTLAAAQAVRYAQAGVQGLEGILKPLESQVKAGKITPAEFNRVFLQRETAAIAMADAEENLRRARRDLATLLNIPPAQASDIEVVGTLRDTAPPPPTSEALIQIALENRPDLCAFRLAIGRNQSEVTLARRNAFNDVYVLYQPYTFQDNSPFNRLSAHSWALGLTVALPVYNRNQGVIRRAELNLVQTRTELAALERQVINEVQQAEREYQISRGAVDQIERVLQPAAVQVLKTVRRQYEEGSINVITFITARQDYNQVVKQYLDALIRHRRSMLDLNTAVGMRLLP